MVREPEENSHEEAHDFTPFSKIRRIDLDPDSVVGKELPDAARSVPQYLHLLAAAGRSSDKHAGHALVSYLVALALLIVSDFSLWVTMAFPVWVLMVSGLLLARSGFIEELRANPIESTGAHRHRPERP